MDFEFLICCYRPFCLISHPATLASTKLLLQGCSRARGGWKWISAFLCIIMKVSQGNGEKKPPNQIYIKKKKTRFWFTHKQLSSFIDTGRHQEVCRYFINLKLVKKEITKQLKWKENASLMSLWVFRSKHFRGEPISLSHRAATQKNHRSPGGTSRLANERHEIGFWSINHITWKWLARFSASLKDMFANVFIKV